MNYYNELDSFPAQWIENLGLAGLLPPGELDTRDIKQVQAADLVGYTQCHFFAGIAGWSEALRLAGWPEDEQVWTGSCPCQPFSQAGKRRGFEDERHLWPVWLQLIEQCRPPTIFGEQVASPLGRDWLDRVRVDLEALGYAVGAADLCAAGIGAPHIRQRLYWVAHSNSSGCSQLKRRQGSSKQNWRRVASTADVESWLDHWLSEPEESWVVDGLSKNVGAVRAYGNAIIPQVGAIFIHAFMMSHNRV